MGKIKRQRPQIIKPCKRVPIEYIGGIYKIAVHAKKKTQGGLIGKLLGQTSEFGAKKINKSFFG